MQWFGIICGLVSLMIGWEDTQNRVDSDSILIVHGINLAAGYFFGVSLITFLNNLGKVLEVAGAFAKWFVVASISLLISGSYLILQYHRIFVW